MIGKWASRLTHLLAVVALAAVGTAVAKPLSKNIFLGQTAVFGHAEVKAGQYNLLVDGNKVTVKKDGKIVAETEGQWEERAEKSKYDAVVLGATHQVREVRFAGQKRVLVLQTP